MRPSIATTALVCLTLLAGCGPKAPIQLMLEGISDTPPMPAPAPEFVPPVPVSTQTQTGHDLWVLPKTDLPLISLRVVIPGGSTLDPSDHPGLTSLSNDLLLRGAGERDATAFSAEAERRAIQLRVWTSKEATVLEADCTSDELDNALSLLADATLRPRFDEDEVARTLEQQVNHIKEGLDDPRTVASQLAWGLWFGLDTPYGSPTGGTVEGIATLDAAALRKSWDTRRTAGARFVVVGDVEADALIETIDRHFSSWTGSADRPVAPAGAAIFQGHAGLYMVDQPGAAQTVLRVNLPGATVADPRRTAAGLGVFALGGSFTSRMNRLLREEKGYTYGARAWQQSGPTYGLTAAGTNVFVDQTGPALADLMGLLKDASTGIVDAELDKARSGTRTDAIETAASRSSLADALTSAMIDGLAPDNALREMNAAMSADLTTVNAALNDIRVDGALVVVVGDLAAIGDAVKSAHPGAWMVVDRHGAPVKATP